MSYESKPTVVLVGTGGWADRMPDLAYGGHYLDEAKVGYLHYAKTPVEAVELALRLAAEWRAPAGRYLE